MFPDIANLTVRRIRSKLREGLPPIKIALLFASNTIAKELSNYTGEPLEEFIEEMNSNLIITTLEKSEVLVDVLNNEKLRGLDKVCTFLQNKHVDDVTSFLEMLHERPQLSSLAQYLQVLIDRCRAVKDEASGQRDKEGRDEEVVNRQRIPQENVPEGPPIHDATSLPVGSTQKGQQMGSVPGNGTVAMYQTDRSAVPRKSQPEPLPDIAPLDRETLKLDRNNCLGRGNFGNVYKCDLNGTAVAVKELGIPKKRKAELTESLVNEIRVSERVRHPNIVQFMGYCYDNQQSSCLLLVYEFIDGSDLDDILADDDLKQKYDFHSKSKRYCVLLQVSQALAYLHGQNQKIIHGDIKPANVMVTKTGDAKLCDLGLSKIKKNNAATLITTAAPRGTPLYMAPEQLLDNKTSSTRSDMYAFGALIYEVLFEEYIWDTEEDLDDIDKLSEKMQIERIPHRLEEKADDPSYNVIKKCVEFEHANRLDALLVVDYLKDLYEKAEQKYT